MAKQKTMCGIYTRVSTDMQADKEYNSCQSQEDKIKSFIKSQESFKIYETYSDEGFTGANAQRPALLRMINDVIDGHLDVVIFYKLDRLTRNPKDFYNIVEIFEKHNVGFISITERFDTSTPMGRLLQNIILIMAQFERELTSERTRDKLVQRAKKGMWNGGLVPYGYMRVDKKLVRNQEEASTLRLIYEIYIETGSIAEIYKTLKKKRIKRIWKNQQGEIIRQNFLSKSSIYGILRNPVYIGKTSYSGNIYEGVHEALIKEDFFKIAQSLHKNKICRFKMYKNHLFAGLLKCSACGTMLTPTFTSKYRKGKKKRYFYYRCTTTTKQDWDSCSVQQVSSKRLENLVFKLNHEFESKTNSEGKKEGRVGLEPEEGRFFEGQNPLGLGDRVGLVQRDGRSLFDAKIIKKVIFELLEAATKGHIKDRNFYIKKHVKNIVYSPAWVEIEFYYLENDYHFNDDHSVLKNPQKNKKNEISNFSLEVPRYETEGLLCDAKVSLRQGKAFLSANGSGTHLRSDIDKSQGGTTPRQALPDLASQSSRSSFDRGSSRLEMRSPYGNQPTMFFDKQCFPKDHFSNVKITNSGIEFRNDQGKNQISNTNRLNSERITSFDEHTIQQGDTDLASKSFRKEPIGFKFNSEVRTPNVCKSNSSTKESNFDNESSNDNTIKSDNKFRNNQRDFIDSDSNFREEDFKNDSENQGKTFEDVGNEKQKNINRKSPLNSLEISRLSQMETPHLKNHRTFKIGFPCTIHKSQGKL